MSNYIIILSLILIYTASICTILGSINLWSEKDCGGLKGKILNYGYDKLGILPTNLIGLSFTGLFQTAFLVVVSSVYLLGMFIMPFSYYVGMKFFKSTEVAEYLNGGLWGLWIILAAVIGG